MKKGVFVSKVIITILSVVLILVVIGIPLLMNFTTNDRSPSIGFFMENLMEFLPFAPFILMVLVPVIAVKTFLQHKLGMMDAKKFKQRFYIFSVCEIILLIILIFIMISISASIRTSL